MKTILILSLFVLSWPGVSLAQNQNRSPTLPRVVYPECNLIPFTWADETHKITFYNFKGNRKLKNYFNERIPIQQRFSLSGKIGIQILLNSAGKGCCRSVYLKRGEINVKQLQSIKLDSLINSMPNWTIKNPARSNADAGNYCITIDLEFYGDRTFDVIYDPTIRRKFVQGTNSQTR